ncbi:1225_t:CDS:2 [Scutellospora calospora]|uniref:1225_t:CDS:1 n=1 Tax=Scutellospora calospora TaxID=85575 RepID=A0ACA9K9X9_9GLOM|nr:1225_t:CDS:2 [Scutellospora calospora]
MLNKKSSATASNKKNPSERIKKTIKSIVTSKDIKKNDTDTKNKNITSILNTNKRLETNPDVITSDVEPKGLTKQSGSNESNKNKKIMTGKPSIDKPSKMLSKVDELKNNSGSVKRVQTTDTKKGLSSAASNAETKNLVDVSKRRMSSAARSETSEINGKRSSNFSSRPSTPDIVKKLPSKINLNPSRPTTPELSKKQPLSKINQHPSRPTTPELTKKQSLSKINQRPTPELTRRSTITSTPDITKRTSSRSTSPELTKTAKRPTSMVSNTNSRPASPELTKTMKRPTSFMSVTNSRPVSPDLTKTTKRPTSFMSVTNSRPASPELTKTTKRPTSFMSVTNSRPAVPEVRAKQNRSTQQNESSNLIIKSKQSSQQIPSTTEVIRKRSVSVLSTKSSGPSSRQSSRPSSRQSSRPSSRSSSRSPSPEITKLPETQLILGKSSTLEPSKPSVPEITKSSTTETIRKRSNSVITSNSLRPSTPEITKSTTTETIRKRSNSVITSNSLRPSTPEITKSSTTETIRKRSNSVITSNSLRPSMSEITKLPGLNGRKRSNSSTQVSFSTTFRPTNINNSNINSQIKKKRISFTPLTTTSQISDDLKSSISSEISIEINDKSIISNDLISVLSEIKQDSEPNKTCISTLDSLDNQILNSLDNQTLDSLNNSTLTLDSLNSSTVIDLTSLENTNDRICNNSINLDDKIENKSKDESNNNIEDESKDDSINPDENIKNESKDDSSEEVINETKLNAVMIVNSMMEKVKTIKNVIEVNGTKLPVIVEQDFENSVEEIINLNNQFDQITFLPTETNNLSNKKHDESTDRLDCEKTRVLEIKECATKRQQVFSNINFSGNHNNTLKNNLDVMQSNINSNYNNNQGRVLELYYSSEPAIIEHRIIPTEPYKKYVGSYGTTPQDIHFTNYETQDIIMHIDEKRIMQQQNFLESSEIVFNENTSLESLLNSVDSVSSLITTCEETIQPSNNIVTKEEQQYYDVSINEDENLDAKYKMKKPSYGTFLDLYSYSNSGKPVHDPLLSKDEKSMFSPVCCPIC